MFSRIKLSTKVFVILAPLFFLSVAASVYLNYRAQEQRALEQAHDAAEVQAALIKESLVQMMVTNLRVDDDYLRGLSRASGIHDLKVLFALDSLKLRPDLLTQERTKRLQARQASVWGDQAKYYQRVFSSAAPQWIISCETGLHDERPIRSFSETGLMWFSSCDRLRLILPFTAEPKCQHCHETTAGKVIGAAYMEIPLARTASALRDNAVRSISIFLIFTAVAVGLGIVIFRTFVAKPVQKLVQATEIIGTGEIDERFEKQFHEDEFGKLARSFWQMHRRLKQAQDELVQRERLSTVGQVASSIIHDFRSPMNIISLTVNLLSQKEYAQNRKTELLETINDAVHRMTRMTQEVLDFSRGEVHLEVRDYSVGDFSSAIATEVEPSLLKRGVRFVLQDSYRGMARFDWDRMYRAFMNVINNAQDAIPNEGEIRFQTSMEHNVVVCHISDTGTGIPQEIRAHVFEPFVTSGKPKGTGLGLAITRKIVEQHGGEIRFESEVGKGTTFIITFPVQTNLSQ